MKYTSEPSGHIKPSNAQPEKKLTKKRVGYGALAAVVVTVLAYFLSQFLALLVLSLVAVATNNDATDWMQDLSANVAVQFLYILVVEVVLVYIFWWFLKHRNLSFKDIGMNRKLTSNDLAMAVITFVVYFLTLLVVMGLVGGLTPIDTEQQQQIGFEGVNKNFELIMVFISLAVLPPIAEEIMMRGFMYTGLRKKFKVLTSALLVSGVFAALHLQFGSGEPLLWTAAIDTFVLSMYLVYLREKTGAIWSGMVVHFIKNSLAFLFLFVITTGGM